MLLAKGTGKECHSLFMPCRNINDVTISGRYITASICCDSSSTSLTLLQLPMYDLCIVKSVECGIEPVLPSR